MIHIKSFLSNVYITSILGVAAILIILKDLQFIFGDSPPLLLFITVIAFAAWYGGLIAGFFTTLLSATASAYFLIAPYESFYIAKASEELRIVLLVSVGIIFSLIVSLLYKREKRVLYKVMEREKQLKKEIAERNKTKAERDLYVELAKSSTEFIGMCDMEFMPFFINDAGLSLVGLDSLEQGIKTPVKEFFFPEDQEFVMNEFFPVALKNGRNVDEIRLRHFKTGEAVWIIYNVFTLKDSSGKIVGFATVSTNITDRKRVEEALRESQIDLNRAQAVAHVGSWRLDIHKDKLEWSDENYRIFGVPKDATPLTYQSFLNVVHPEDRKSVDQAWKEALTGKPYDIEHRVVAGKNIKWVRELAELEFDEHGSLLGAFGTTEDITDIKGAQEALHHERAFLRQVIDAAPSMIFVKDKEGRFILGNKSLAHCYGTDPEGLIGLTDADFNFDADEVAHFRQDDLDVIRNREPKIIPEEKVTCRNGDVVHWYSTVKIPLFEDDNSCNKLLGVASDITERKRAEEALRLADRRKDEFLAMLAHELRNPLAPIRNAVQLLKMLEPTDPKLAWSRNVIDRQVTHMARLLDDLLDVARIMQGKIRLNMERFELTEILNNAIETSRPLIESRDQELIVSQTTTPPWIEGDRVRLAQVLSNLLNNAAKYTSEGGKITLSVMREDSSAVIEVRDTGIGISPDILPQIFDLFTQADHSLAHAQGGLGIGLTLVRELVEIHGGTVTASSAGIGQGSTFTVRLPALPMPSSAIESVQAKSALPMPKFRILVVDDYADAAESLTLLLQAEGHEVETADCGLKALERAQAFRPQVVLLDIGLPDLDGYEVARRLRTLPETREAVLVALTGYGQTEDRERSRSAGFNHHLLKPVNFEKLSALLKAA
ncbi:PAS domain S-box protein [Methylobacter sp. YRD-M1]|uniref:PAS domain S-box protein n=1 Tax=Methylobacter sp. YRD-M1 TaxID=2911520 RepID=UPI00227B66D5|nr:PAS domain S-box protein [Methylobacter sp. YRD-M1]WAK03414.1 PAS domain S-box protein [Methylobacter sp. YRD-M1]